MRGEHDATLRKELNVSAAWLADLSPIRSPPPRATKQPTVHRRDVPNPSSSFSKRGYLNRFHDAHGCVPWEASSAPAPTATPYPHLVRSRSPPGSCSACHTSTTQLDASARVGAEASSQSQEAVAAASRVEGTFTAVLAREWPFKPASSDARDFTEAVRFGQESALVHYANNGFREVSSRLAQEAGAVGVEAERYRLSAQGSTAKCRDAMKAYVQSKVELAEAQEKLQALLTEAERRDANADRPQGEALHASPNESDRLHPAPVAHTDTSSGALTLQLDQELTNMRTQKQWYELLCVQKARLETEVEEWTTREAKLAAKLERAQVRRGQTLEGLLKSAHTAQASPPLVEYSLHGEHPAMLKWQRDFDICITERQELLRHLQGGSARRFEQLKDLLTRLQQRNTRVSFTGGSASQKESLEASAAESTAPEKPPVEQQRRLHPAAVELNVEAPLSTVSQLLDRLSKVQLSVSLGEEEALVEMEHLRILLQRLQRQERNE